MTMSSNTHSSFTLDLSANSNMVGVGNKSKVHILDKVSIVITLMDTPKSIKVFFIGYPMINLVTTRILWFAYFLITNMIDIKLAIFPPT